ncbi:ATP-dependent helicase [Candidatus Saccharibacteria bacterium]|nr:ATP-dependent helicase [Candidatus Saccharibacteria bacterium]
MTTFSTRYNTLNDAQQRAVDSIDGPLLVIAGPGTGKTELLSMRAANILRQTDTLPGNILCLTFTDSGAAAMRARLADIIGPEAYKVAIHTFHSFGSEVINQNNQYFYHGAEYRPADEIASYELLTGIFDELDYTNPLASKNNGSYTHLADTVRVISELKQSGLSSDELRLLIDANETTLDSVEQELSTIFAQKISLAMLTQLAPLAEQVAALPSAILPPAVTPLANVLALSMAHMFDAAADAKKTTPITAWRNEWLEKDTTGAYVFKDRKRHQKMRALSHIYFTYLSRMEHEGLYDYDDMILNVVHSMETQPDLKYNLQEKYHYIMVDEFQDTNLAQLRILFGLTDNPANEGSPNVMAVGDDDQAIYSFQGADVNNIHRFRERYPTTDLLVLTENYRSVASVIHHAREVITQGDGRLESSIESLHKELRTHLHAKDAEVGLYELPSASDERAWIAEHIAARITSGARPSDITVIARKHSELVELLPFLYHHNLLVNYERRDNVLDIAAIQAIELIAKVVTALHERRLDDADSLLPELLSHPAFDVSPELLWRTSITSYRNRLTWMETIATSPQLAPLHAWLLELSSRASHDSLETIIDTIIGTPTDIAGDDVSTFRSPLYEYYFGADVLAEQPDAYLVSLEALRTIRSKLREYHSHNELHLRDYLEFVDTHRSMGSTLTSVRRRSDHLEGAINVMTAHKSKGLEFKTVYILGAIDTTWGERVRSRARLIAYPENLQLSPAGDTFDERLRLFFVAMTRAKQNLFISYSRTNDSAKETLAASFLVGTSLTPQVITTTQDLASIVHQTELSWHDTLTRNPTRTMRDLLAPQLETYKLSSTHLNNFIDITRGGPARFLMNNLLHFPQAKSPHASYGTAIHRTLQRAHNHLVATGNARPIEDVLGDFQTELREQHLPASDEVTFLKKGVDSLSIFLHATYSTFNATQRTEVNFANQAVKVGDALLTGSLDLVDIQDSAITVTDYKTGKPSTKWQGSADYEKVKLHKYKQQLMFYQLLIENSRDYQKYRYAGGVLQFVEPDTRGDIHSLDLAITADELTTFAKLLGAIWHCIINLELPTTDEFEPNYKGVLAFEQHLIDKYTK